MSIETVKTETADGEPIPTALIELQQIAVGLFLVWDTLEGAFFYQEIAEMAILMDWARKHKIGRAQAMELLEMTKDRLLKNPWFNYVHCRNYEKEGWGEVFMTRPRNNQDALKQIEDVMKNRPFGIEVEDPQEGKGKPVDDLGEPA